MIKVAFLLLIIGLAITFWGIRTLNKRYRVLGLQIAGVGFALIFLSGLNIPIFPAL